MIELSDTKIIHHLQTSQREIVFPLIKNESCFLRLTDVKKWDNVRIKRSANSDELAVIVLAEPTMPTSVNISSTHVF